MREAAARRVWHEMRKMQGWPDLTNAADLPLPLTDRCVVVGGLNGAGKSRLLRSLTEVLGSTARYIDLHSLSQRALKIARSRTDIEEMLDEYSPVELQAARRADVSRIVGRTYEEVDWYALDLDDVDEPNDPFMPWLGDEPLPFFRVTFDGVSYSSPDMGLGELGVHLLFWYLEQWRDQGGIEVLVLDEPDAYLPPVAAQALIRRLISVCTERRWRLVVSSHAQPVIEDAVKQNAFVRIEMASGGRPKSTHVSENAAAAEDLLADPPLQHIAYVEDESAFHLLRALLRAFDRQVARSTAVIWGNGSGYMEVLREKIPVPPGATLRFSFVFDGDKRTKVGPSKPEWWPSVFLPTEGDPDDLFMTVGSQPELLAAALLADPTELRWKLADGGKDSHDWVNDLGTQYGRPRVLAALADLWVELNPELVKSFEDELRSALRT